MHIEEWYILISNNDWKIVLGDFVLLACSIVNFFLYKIMKKLIFLVAMINYLLEAKWSFFMRSISHYQID